jgi:hypothetical protein
MSPKLFFVVAIIGLIIGKLTIIILNKYLRFQIKIIVNRITAKSYLFLINGFKHTIFDFVLQCVCTKNRRM